MKRSPVFYIQPSMLTVYYIIKNVKYIVKSKKMSITRRPLFVVRIAYVVRLSRQVGWRSLYLRHELPRRKASPRECGFLEIG